MTPLSSRVSWINGALVDAAAALVSASDRGFTLGDGLFETVRAYGDRVFDLPAHLDRLACGAALIGLPIPFDLGGAVRAVVDASLATHLAENTTAPGRSSPADLAIRITLSRGPGDGLTPPLKPEPTVVVTARPYTASADWYTHGIRAVLVHGCVNEHSPARGLKRLGCLDHVQAQRMAAAHGAEEALLCNTQGHIAEGAASNVFLVTAGRLVTPTLACGALPGITRRHVLELAQADGLEVVEAPVSPEELHRADEIFVTSSLRELVPVVAVDGRPVRSGHPGAITRQLHTTYRQRVGDEAERVK